MRGVALAMCCSVFDTGGAHDRAVEIEREVLRLAETLDNRFLRALNSSSRMSGIHLTEPDGGAEYLRRAHAIYDELGMHANNGTVAMFLALYELRAGDRPAAARWATVSVQRTVDYTSTYLGLVTNAVIAVVSRPAPVQAAELLGALRAYRVRSHQHGTKPETDAETHYETVLRRRLGDEFDAHYARGLTLDDAAMVDLALTQLAVIADSTSDADNDVAPDRS